MGEEDGVVTAWFTFETKVGRGYGLVRLRDGRIAFDLPTAQVQPEHLQALYANEQLQATPSSPVQPQPVHIPRC